MFLSYFRILSAFILISANAVACNRYELSQVSHQAGVEKYSKKQALFKKEVENLYEQLKTNQDNGSSSLSALEAKFLLACYKYITHYRLFQLPSVDVSDMSEFSKIIMGNEETSPINLAIKNENLACEKNAQGVCYDAACKEARDIVDGLLWHAEQGVKPEKSNLTFPDRDPRIQELYQKRASCSK